MFRDLDSTEEQEFRQWARDNHKAGMEISSAWHPVVVEECTKIDKEACFLLYTNSSEGMVVK